MADDQQYIFPVLLPKRITDDENVEDYDTSITQNENMLNQNFMNIYNRQSSAESRINAVEALVNKMRKSMEG